MNTPEYSAPPLILTPLPDPPNRIVHAIASVLTGGLWLIGWLIIERRYAARLRRTRARQERQLARAERAARRAQDRATRYEEDENR
ncbi:hypothetical protein D3C74_287870 [compost metagenome]